MTLHLKQIIMDSTISKIADGFKITGNWESQAKELKIKYPQLTDADLKFEAGKENELLGRVESRLHKNRDEVIAILNKMKTEKV
jgi:uncharacterized protein YjbJ (UPF0337 family)